MKKFLAIFFLCLIGGAVYLNWSRLAGFIKPGSKLQNFAQLLQTPAVGDLKKQVFAPGPLRVPVESPQSSLTRAGVIAWTNNNRRQNGKINLTENSLLNKAAQLKLKDMFDKQYFEHVSPSGTGPGDLAKAVNYDYIEYGENLALGNFKGDEALVTAWMNSPGHRANILNGKFEEIGVAVGQGLFEGKKTWLAVQEFGRPASSCPAVDSALKPKIDSEQNQVSQLEEQLRQAKALLDGQNPQTSEENAAYNRQVAQYNNLVAVYNNQVDTLKQTVNLFNNQVQIYNACAAQ